MYILVIVLILLLGLVSWRLVLKKNKVMRMTSMIKEHESELEETYKRVWDLIEENRAIIEGRDEQEENYEMQFLTFKETIEDLNDQIKKYNEKCQELEAHLDKHDRECLPNTYDAAWRPHASSDESVDPPLYSGQEKQTL